MAYRICTRCVMDTSDPDITFDSDGICNHCKTFDTITRMEWFPNQEGERRLRQIIDNIKKAGASKEYDCVLGLSGGVDSCYLAIKMHEWGLRPLVIHVDAGWNSELAVANIEKVIKYCNFNLKTVVINWQEMKDLQIAYLKSGIANQDVPQDHIFFSSLYQHSIANGMRYIFSGGNIATEGIFPKSWHGPAMDASNLYAIHKKFGKHKLKTYKTISFSHLYFWLPLIKKMRTIRPLNFINYSKKEAIKTLETTCGWKNYGRKHGESQFTKFFQNYYLPMKFGYDKRRPHLSSLIVAGQLDRSEALITLEEPLYQEKELEADLAYICKKLNLTSNQLAEYINSPCHSYSEFKNWDARFKFVKKIQYILTNIFGKYFNIYS